MSVRVLDEQIKDLQAVVNLNPLPRIKKSLRRCQSGQRTHSFGCSGSASEALPSCCPSPSITLPSSLGFGVSSIINALGKHQLKKTKWYRLHEHNRIKINRAQVFGSYQSYQALSTQNQTVLILKYWTKKTKLCTNNLLWCLKEGCTMVEGLFQIIQPFWSLPEW